VRLLAKRDHQRKPERIAAGAGKRHAHDAARVTQEKRNRLGGRALGGEDQIAFVFALGVVNDDDGLSARDSLYRFVDGRQWHDGSGEKVACTTA
jgi:hypothetical protein